MINEKEFKKLLEADLSFLSEKKQTFFDIAGFPQRETVMSNFYYYFFDPNESHGFEDLFLLALLNLVKEKTEIEFSFKNYDNIEIEREFRTDKGNYIDLVIRETNEAGETNKAGETINAIIIENKVYASLYNNLEDYYKSVTADNKIGIVLSLNDMTGQIEERRGGEDFINITHQELKQEIERLKIDSLNEEKEYNYLLNHFLLNIENMSTQTKKIKELYKFYSQNVQQILKLNQLQDDYQDAIKERIGEAINKLDLDLKEASKGKKLFSYHSQVAPVIIEFWIGDLFNGKNFFNVDVALYKLDKKGDRKTGFEKVEFTENQKELILKDGLNTSVFKAGFEKDLGEDFDIENLDNFIVEKFEEGGENGSLKSIFLKLEKGF